jgi:hypothetical protein
MTAAVVFGVLLAGLCALVVAVAWWLHHHDPAPGEWEEAEPWIVQLRGDTVPFAPTRSTPPWPPLVPTSAPGQGGAQPPGWEPVAPWRGRRADHQEADGNPAGSQPPEEAVDSLTGAAARVRELSLDDYEAELPSYPHHPAWYATLDPERA